ncbi:AMP-binding protein [Pandoraea pnomenusa]|uniref:AMP-binding protein n=1 Tax=Pandoraea pnomenusa TaxID=93220 RepID=UPI001AC70B92|nr:AMP-binding protein [Pandoraea pnomenusa]MBN9094590.1 AMP-binding protein [Pandoraea pnomenusa]
MPQTLNFEDARDLLLAQRAHYDVAYRDFRWPVLTRFNWALDFFDPQAQGNDRPALLVVEEDGRETRLSFAEMSARSNRVANFLRQRGVARGDRVLLMLPNQVELWDLMLACMKLGAVMIPATTLLAAGDLVDRLERGRVRHVITTAREAAKFAALAGDYQRLAVGEAPPEGWTPFAPAYEASDRFVPDGETLATDPLLLYFTSGTTSRPKLVLHTHQSYPVGHLATMYWLGLQPGDLHWNISSPGWAKHAWSCFFAPWNAGAAIFIYNFSRFDARTALQTAARCEVTTLCAPPTVWRMMIQEDLARHPVKFRELIGAGEPLNPEVIDQVRRAWNITIRDGYGQTETCCQIGNSPGQPVKAGAMGRPMPGYRVVLLDHDGNETDEGEICLALASRPTGLMQGYEDDREKTAEVMRDGYYHTGDVAMRDERGYFTYVGRADDVFKASDYRISPFELESELIKHPAVAEAGVVPSPDPVRLAVPKAFVSLRSGFQADDKLALDILRFCRDHLAPYKRIRRIEFCELPKTISGKIRRVELRRAEAGRALELRREMEFWDVDFPDLK